MGREMIPVPFFCEKTLMRILSVAAVGIACIVAITSPCQTLGGGPKKPDRSMNEKDIRPALTRLMEAYPRVFTDLSKKIVKEERIERVEGFGPEVYRLGNFVCDLEKNKFSYIGYQYRGVFLLDQKSQWTGRITHMTAK
jgi:hypothetical protein